MSVNDLSLEDIIEAQKALGLPSPALVEKDFHVTRIINVLATLDTAPFLLVFGGGTALARAHKLVRRMSEGVDFKIISQPSAPVSRSGLRRQRSALRDRVTTALLGAGFIFDPKDSSQTRSRDENSYTIWQIPYPTFSEAKQGLRPTIQIELNHTTLRRPTVKLPVSSFVAAALKHPPEVPSLPCVSIIETAAEKLVSLTRRTAMELAGASRDPDPALVRHIYDLHMMRAHIDANVVSTLAQEISASDAGEFNNQYPAYAEDIQGETRKALAALRDDPLYRSRYGNFLTDMVYGEHTEFDVALATVFELAERAWAS